MIAPLAEDLIALRDIPGQLANPVPLSTVYGWLAQGLPSGKVAGVRCTTLEAVSAFLDGRCQQADRLDDCTPIDQRALKLPFADRTRSGVDPWIL